jgi:DHA2 family multidrug resistance protein
LLATGLAALEILLDEGQRDDWFGSNLIVAAAAIAGVALVGAVVWQLRQSNPVIDFRILKNWNFGVSAVAMYAVGFTLYGSTAILPIFLQTVLGYTATLSGLVLSPGGIAMMFGMAVVGKLLAKFEARWLIVFGLVVASIGLFRMAAFNLTVDFQSAMWARTIQALGMAFLFVPINTTAFSAVPREKLGYATGLMNLFRNIGGSGGIAMVNTILARREQFHQQTLMSHLTPLDGSYQSTLQSITTAIAGQGASAADAANQAQGVLYGIVQKNAAMLAAADTFWTLAVVFLCLIPIIVLLRKSRPHEGPLMVE